MICEVLVSGALPPNSNRYVPTNNRESSRTACRGLPPLRTLSLEDAQCLLLKWPALSACIDVVICINGGQVVETVPEIRSMEYPCAEVFDARRNAIPSECRRLKDMTASTQLHTVD